MSEAQRAGILARYLLPRYHPAHLPTLNEHDDEGEDEDGGHGAMVAWERVWPPKGKMRVVSGGARRHLFFPRLTFLAEQSSYCKPTTGQTHPVSLSPLSGWLSTLSLCWQNNPMQAPWERTTSSKQNLS